MTQGTTGQGGSQDPGQQPRIHVDDDWKRQAQAEKERLAREAEAGAHVSSGPAQGQAAGAGAEARGRIPAPTFIGLVQTIATQAAIFMSEQRDPETGQPIQNLDLAKHNIDLLGVLEEKTRGNLADEEKKLLDRLLYELRMAYINAAS